jgi:dolichol-phosphate mannosyltransferase
MPKKISIVVPIYNEGSGLVGLYDELKKVLVELPKLDYQLIFCNDGSTDNTVDIIKVLADKDKQIVLVSLSRNFGKEAALAAGIARADGDAIISIDGDSQHPVELIPEFIKMWQNGARVVVGIRKGSVSDRYYKRFGSRTFYKIFNHLSSQKLIPGSRRDGGTRKRKGR